MKPIGIAIVTFNRLDRLRDLVAHVKAMTTSPYELVVADDGSTDGTASWCRKQGLRVVTGSNRGVCWNKNRGLFALTALGCDPLLLLEDDSRPVEAGWEDHWRRACALWGHVSYAHPKLGENAEGDGSAEAPFVNHKSTAQCAGVSAEGLARLGYFDTRFKGYGIGHAEWTMRGKRLGFGFKPAPLPGGGMGNASLYIRGGLEADDAPSFRDNEAVMQNRVLFDMIKGDPEYRAPWSDERERSAFIKEQIASGLSPEVVEAMAPAVVARARLRKLDPHGLARVREEFKRRLPEFRMRSFFEVGAHIGESVRAIRSLYPDAKVYAFEPVPETHALLEEAFAGDKAVARFDKALGAQAGSVTLKVKGTTPGAHVVPKSKGPQRVEVSIKTGDQVMADLGLDAISYLRIDTEGHELEVLAGFAKALQAASVDVVEVSASLSDENTRHASFERLKTHLEGLGYRLFSIRNQAHDRFIYLRRCSLVFVSEPVLAQNRKAAEE